MIPRGWIYNLLESDLNTSKPYNETSVANGRIQMSSSPAAAPIVFDRKNDGGLGLCIHYRALNSGTVENQYPLQLISEMLGCVH